MLIEDKIEKLERWIAVLSADNRRLQEQVETLRKELRLVVGQRDFFMKINENNSHRAEAAEAERDRLREDLTKLCDWVEHEVGSELPFDARAALQKEHQP